MDSLKDQEIEHYRELKRFLFLRRDNKTQQEFDENIGIYTYGSYEANLAQVASTIAAAATSGDMFSMLAVDDIERQEVLVPSSETLKLPDYEPSQR